MSVKDCVYTYTHIYSGFSSYLLCFPDGCHDCVHVPVLLPGYQRWLKHPERTPGCQKMIKQLLNMLTGLLDII